MFGWVDRRRPQQAPQQKRRALGPHRDSMSGEAEQPIRSELGPGESLLWRGMPKQGIRLQASDLFLVPFSLLWGGFAVFWELSAIRRGGALLDSLWGIPFVLVGLYMIVGRFLVDAYQRSHTYYGLSNQRAIIIRGIASRQVTSVALQGLHDTALTERADQSGTIRLGPANPYSALGTGSGWPGFGTHAPPAFNMISDARRVYEQLRTAQASLTRGGA